MLVLSRKSGESIVIDGDIRLTIVKVAGNRVRLGIEAPSDVTVTRSELQRHPVAVAAVPTVSADPGAACATT